MSNQLLFLSFLTAGISTLFAIQALRPIAKRYGLVDIKNDRKLHIGEIPLVGGIAMYIGVLIGALIVLPMAEISITWLLTSAGIVSLGVIDDAQDLSVKSRLKVQVLVTLILSIGSGYYLMNIGDLLGFGDIHLGYLGYLVTIFAVIGAINAFNMMDGIDGLAGMMALVSFGALAILFKLGGDINGLSLSMLLITVITPFLANNLLLPPFKNKIFMGDAGSMFIGFSVVWLLVYGSQSPSAGDVSFRPVTAIWIIAVPLMDMTAIMIRRIRKGQSPFKADRDHLHHIFMHAGFSSSASLLIISVLAIIFATIGILGEVWNIPENVMLVCFLILFVGYNYAIQHAWKFSQLIHKNKS